MAVGAGSQVDELVLEEAVVHDGEATRLNEPARRERRHRRLERPALADQTAGDHRERALGVRLDGRLGQWEPHAETVVTAGVVELGGDAHQPLARMQLEAWS